MTSWFPANELRFRAWRLRDAVGDRLGGKAHRTTVFRRIHRLNLWGDQESASGTGSGTKATEAIRRELPSLLRAYEVRSLLDAPCGDFFWMRKVATPLERYVGVDIVPELIEQNEARFGSRTRSFMCADLTSDPLPCTDLILCRDCFIHLPTRLIRAALRNFVSSGARLLLLTNDHDIEAYHDIPIGSFRRVDFTRPPFNLPTPLATLSEDPTGNRQLCLWDLRSLATNGYAR